MSQGELLEAWTPVLVLADAEREDGSTLTEDEVRTAVHARRLVAASCSGEDYGEPGAVGLLLAVGDEERVAAELPDGGVEPAQDFDELMIELASALRSRMVAYEELEYLPDGTVDAFTTVRDSSEDTRTVFAWRGHKRFDEHLLAAAVGHPLRVHRSEGWTVATLPEGVPSGIVDPRFAGVSRYPFVIVVRFAGRVSVEWFSDGRRRRTNGSVLHFPHVRPVPTHAGLDTEAHALAAQLETAVVQAWYFDPRAKNERIEAMLAALEAAARQASRADFLTATLELAGAGAKLASLVAREVLTPGRSEGELVEPRGAVGPDRSALLLRARLRWTLARARIASEARALRDAGVPVRYWWARRERPD